MRFWVSIMIVLLAALSIYFIMDFSSNLQLKFSSIDDLPKGYLIIFRLSKITSSLIPIVISLFLITTLSVMLNNVFDQKISVVTLIESVGIGYIPMTLYYYFFWYNLIEFGNRISIHSVEDFRNIRFMFNLDIQDLENINLCCWFYLYLFLIVSLKKKNINFGKVIISVLLPSAIFLFIYYVI